MGLFRRLFVDSCSVSLPPVLHCVGGSAVFGFILLVPVTPLRAESPGHERGTGERVASQRRIGSPDARHGRFKVSLKILLAADAAARALDGFSTVRMLRNRCDGDLSVPVCNEEMFLPDFITRSSGAVYGYEAGMWIAQVVVVHKLAKHHQRLPRFIPTVDVVTTLPFAVNNLRLPLNPRAK